MSKEPIFVIQKHQATHLHYDFRLQAGKILKSWAVPKGLSTATSDKRLAILTEDHPLSYADFEGEIPRGQYGAGKVVLWDKGHYQNIKKDKQGHIIPISKCFEKGHIEIILLGKRFTGAYTLVRLKEKNWLIIKMKDV